MVSVADIVVDDAAKVEVPIGNAAVIGVAADDDDDDVAAAAAAAVATSESGPTRSRFESGASVHRDMRPQN
jgi:hypothetical protein